MQLRAHHHGDWLYAELGLLFAEVRAGCERDILHVFVRPRELRDGRGLLRRLRCARREVQQQLQGDVLLD
jgi:hypothetical protein